MTIRGEYELQFDNGEKLIVPNRITETGFTTLLNLGFRNFGVSDLKFGFTNLPAPDYDPGEANSNQPTSGGYGLANTAGGPNGWDTIVRFVEDEAVIATQPLRFFASGVWDRPVNRAFMCNISAATVLSVSAPFPSGPIIMSADFNLVYRIWMR